MSMNIVPALASHASQTHFSDLPNSVVEAAKIFILDTIGVGISGSSAPWAAELTELHRGDGCSARLLGTDIAISRHAAAMINAVQIHNSEFDCVHEDAVVHPMAVLCGTLFAAIDSRGEELPAVSGQELISAIAIGVDIAAGLGLAANSGLRFFRPATAGGFAATAAACKIAAADAETIINAWGINLGQACGTMQAHTEGSPVLAMQVGFNARNALLASELALLGVPGPRASLVGPYGYFSLFEEDASPQRTIEHLGRRWLLEEVAHKPYPSGRATHGIVDACLSLRAAHEIDANRVAKVTARVPPLTKRLVGRPVHDAMAPNYARLCAQYVAARAIMYGKLNLDDFKPASLGDAESLAHAAKIEIVADNNPDPNALTPVEIQILLHDGTRFDATLNQVYGNPAKPMPRAEQIHKFKHNWSNAQCPLSADDADQVLSLVDKLQDVDDVRSLLDLCTAAPRS